MPTGFHEVRFPTAISFGSTGGPTRRTDVVTLRSGSEERNSVWAGSLRRYDAGTGVKTAADLSAVVAFWEERRGRLYGFRWKDFFDFSSAQPGAAISALDQPLGTGDGVKKVFALAKVYGAAYAPWTRPIGKPVAGTVQVAVAGLAVASGWSVDTTTGLITFTTPPSLGAALNAGFEFDVPVRFDADAITLNMSHFGAGQIQSIPVVEVRV